MFSHQTPQETRGGMVVERGIVSRDHGHRVLIFVQEAAQCERCDSRLDCHGTDGKTKQVEAVNDAGARVGDLVEFGVPSGLLLKVMFLVFFLPMIAAVGGGFLGRFSALTWAWPMTISVICGVLLALILAYIPIRILDKRVRSGEKFVPRITRILNPRVACANSPEIQDPD